MFETLRALKDTVDKKRFALDESLELSEFLTPQSYTMETDPFPHIIADNFLQPAAYANLERFFMQCLDRGLSLEDRSRFHLFLDLKKRGKEFEYDGYVHVPKPEEDESLKLFFNLTWNLFVSRLFRQPTTFATTAAFHHHPPGDRTGFVHHDYTPMNFSALNTLQNGVVYHNLSVTTPNSYRYMRAIALILYIGEEALEEGNGGGTGLYRSKGTSPVKVVSPLANRLLAFQISPRSLHAFQTNRTVRNTFTQWFHVDPLWCQKTYGFV